MADRYWVGGGSDSTWHATGDTNWGTASNTQDNAAVPTAADDVYLDGVGTGATDCDIAAEADCRSINCTGFANDLSLSTSTDFNIGDGTAPAGNIALKFVAGMTYTLGGIETSRIVFKSTAGTTQEVDGAGKKFADTYFSGAGTTYQLTGTWGTSDVYSAAYFLVASGTVDTNDQAVFSGSLNIYAAGTLTLGATVMTLYRNRNSGDIINASATCTINANTSKIVLASNGTTWGWILNARNAVWNELESTAYGTSLMYGGGTCDTFTLTGPANTGVSVYFYNYDFTITGELKAIGNSSKERVLIYTSNTIDFTVTGATLSNCENVNFRNVSFVSTGAVDFSAITGGSGDCQGNSISGGGALTFTTADDWYWNGSGTRDFSDYTYWYTATNGGGSQMGATLSPLPQDTCYFDGDSIDGATTIDQDMGFVPSTDFSGVDAMNFHMNNVNQGMYGSLILTSNVTLTEGGSSQIMQFLGQSAFLYASGSCTTGIGYMRINMIGGSLTLQDSFSGYASYCDHDVGELDMNDQNTEWRWMYSSNSGVRTWKGGTGTHTLTYNQTPTFTFSTTTNLTFDAETCKMLFDPSAASAGLPASFGGLTWYDVEIDISSAFNAGKGVVFHQSSTFNTITIPEGINFIIDVGDTQTFTSLVAVGTEAEPILIKSDASGEHFLVDTGGTNAVEWCTITDSNASGGATWDATTDCTDGTGNTGWDFGGGWVSGGKVKNII